MSYCTSCGAAIAAGKRFCSTCGAAVAAPAPASSDAAAPSSVTPSSVAPSSGGAPPPAPPPPVPSGVMGPVGAVGADGVVGRVGRDPAVLWLQAIAVVIAAVGMYLPWYRLPGRSFNAFELPAAVVLSFETTFRTLELGTVILVAIGIALGSLVAPGLLHRATMFSGIGLAGIVLLFTIQSARSISGTGQGLTDVVGLGPIVVGVAGVLLIVARVRAGSAGVGSEAAAGGATTPPAAPSPATTSPATPSTWSGGG